MRKLILAAALAVPAIAPVLASAAPSANNTVTLMTHSPGHLDTTSGVSTGVDSPGGPVWAYDNLALRYTVTPEGPSQWKVAIESQGSFAGFANPINGLPDINNGSTKGNITYEVSTSNRPDPSLVPAQEPNGTSIRLPIMQMFGLGTDASPISGGDNYNFTYNRVDGTVYTQSA